mgnify:CR=1 FL=1
MKSNIIQFPAANEELPSFNNKVSFISEHVCSQHLRLFLWENWYSVGTDSNMWVEYLEIISIKHIDDEILDESSSQNEKYRFWLNSTWKILYDDIENINDEWEPFIEKDIGNNLHAIILLETVEKLVLKFIQDKSIGIEIWKKYSEEIQTIVNM